MLKKGFIQCYLISLTCTYSVSLKINQLTFNYRCCGSLISELIKLLHVLGPIIYPTHIRIYTSLIENIKYQLHYALPILHTQTNP